MKLTGLHLLLTYRCNRECDHCFTWGGPLRSETMTPGRIKDIMRQAADVGTVETVFFEGGEPFLFPVYLMAGVRLAMERGFGVGVVTNAFWATSISAAYKVLEPLAGQLKVLQVSADAYHGEAASAARLSNVDEAAKQLRIPLGSIKIARPGAMRPVDGGLAAPEGCGPVMYRGRAAAKLAPVASTRPVERFNRCAYENLVSPKRWHVDPLGHVHVCQGVTAGNLFDVPLKELVRNYDPAGHPIVGPLVEGGPAALAARYGVPPLPAYADACHCCYETRRALRGRFPAFLAPDAMYGE